MNLRFAAIIVILVALFVVIALMAGGNDDGQTTDKDQLSNNTIGTSEKGLELVEAFDLACPGCYSYYPILKELREEYSDKVVFRLRHFPLIAIHPNAQAAHRAVEAASKQGKFWEMHDLLFEKRDEWVLASTGVRDPLPKLFEFAQDLGLDMDQFETDFKSEEVNNIIKNDVKLMEDQDIESTPTFIFNGQILDNEEYPAQRWTEPWKELFDQALGIQEEEEITTPSDEEIVPDPNQPQVDENNNQTTETE